MKFLDEYRDPAQARALAAAIHRITTRDWRIMEICGGQTHSILRFGIDQLIPPNTPPPSRPSSPPPTPASRASSPPATSAPSKAL
ncbi:MAG: hypothetical protein HY821_04135, partial [Acidobacteria bacterium]|nr:hypothetical protein [Acidobacteriota bacterium]